MYTFTSVNNRFVVFGKPVNGIPEYIANFSPIGSMGKFTTEDSDLALKLRSHPEFGKRFMEIGAAVKENPNIVQGIRSSDSHPEIGKVSQDDKEKLIEFGKLQATLLRNSGEYRKDATPENIAKYELLKDELSV